MPVLERWWRAALHHSGLDGAISWSIAIQALNLLRSPVNLSLLVLFLTPREQGIWYAFTSLGALTIMADLGFMLVITQFVSHGFAKIADYHAPASTGSPERAHFHATIRRAFQLYTGVALLAVILLTGAGLVYFATESAWLRAAWVAYSVIGGVKLLSGLMQAVYQGIDQVKQAQINAFITLMVTSVVTWICLALGISLWSLVIGTAIGIVASVLLLLRAAPALWRAIAYEPTLRNARELVREILPLQSKYAVSWLCGYMIFYVSIPASFKFLGATVAGQFGLSMALVGIVGSISGSWTSTKVPRLNMLVSLGQEREALALGRITGLRSAAVYVLLALGLLASIAALQLVLPYYAGRMLDVKVTALLLLGQLAQTLINAMAVYLRAHREDPLMPLSILSAVCAAPNIFLVMPRFGLGVFIGVEAAILALLILPLCCRIFATHRDRYLAAAPPVHGHEA